MHKLTVPISDNEIEALHVGDQVLLNGVITTARDAAHKFLVEKYIRVDEPKEELELLAELEKILDGGAIYHCGPVVAQNSDGSWRFVAAGPTTSIREEVYEPEVIEHFNVKAIIGKGGMGPNTLKANQEHKAVYLSAVGGAASLIADAVKKVITVYKKDEFGVPEAFWIIQVEDFPAVVTMDAHGRSIHDEVAAESQERLVKMVS
ncbi:MAG: fumarate hydratase C-terminal domain-containing protein [Anaerolineales bacterium]|nr:fumarate hydratase C-terminal domain-containing protein [Anaerolineales bacterium]